MSHRRRPAFGATAGLPTWPAERKPTRRQRRESVRLSEARRAAFAAALPPPDPDTQVDPVTGRAAAEAAAVATRARRRAADRASLTASTSTDADARRAETFEPRSRVREVPTPPSLAPSATMVRADSASPDARRAWSARWSGPAARVAVAVGLLGAVVSVAVVAGWALPVLGHGWRWHFLAYGLIGLILSGGIVTRGWRATGRRARVALVAAAVVAASAFCVGALTNPVIIDGRVFLSTSAQARSYRFVQSVQADLETIAQADTLLTLSAADAGSRSDQYPAAHDTLAAMVDRYTRSPGPGGEFTPVVDSLKSAAYNEALALEAMFSYLQQPDQKFLDDRGTFRTTAAQAFVQAGRNLKFAAVAAGVPLSTKVHE